MVETRTKEFIDLLKAMKKVDILYTFKGMDAMNKVKQIEFTDEEEADKWADQWADQWTTTEKKKSCLIIYSRLKRVIGDSALGTRYTYEKGMKMIHSLV